MATLDQILNGMIAFRDEVYSRLDGIDTKINEIKSIMDNEQIYVICSDCKGEGLIWGYPAGPGSPPAYSYTCPVCGGAGKRLWGEQKL